MHSDDIDTGSLGSLGYVYESIRILGYLLGSLFVYLHLSDQPYCRNCKLYFNAVKEKTYLSIEPFNYFLQNSGIVFDGLVQEINEITRTKNVGGLTIKLYECSNCHQQFFRFGITKDDEKIRDYYYDGDFDNTILDYTNEELTEIEKIKNTENKIT